MTLLASPRFFYTAVRSIRFHLPYMYDYSSIDFLLLTHSRADSEAALFFYTGLHRHHIFFRLIFEELFFILYLA